jgi:hypothetical protein
MVARMDIVGIQMQENRVIQVLLATVANVLIVINHLAVLNYVTHQVQLR